MASNTGLLQFGQSSSGLLGVPNAAARQNQNDLAVRKQLLDYGASMQGPTGGEVFANPAKSYTDANGRYQQNLKYLNDMISRRKWFGSHTSLGVTKEDIERQKETVQRSAEELEKINKYLQSISPMFNGQTP